MRLSAFILANMEPILMEWELFARSLGKVTTGMDALALRDHAELMLQAIAADLETAQTDAQQDAKSKGHAPPRTAELPDSAAVSHGAHRAEEGFSLSQMVSEYRALRASVLRLWAADVLASPENPPATDLYQQQLRFNEAIDEALADSIKSYSYAIDQRLMNKARRRMEMLGTLTAGLGHDMANVLMPMSMDLDTLSKHALSSEAAPLVVELNNAVEHLRGLTRGLRALSMDPDSSAGSTETTVLHDWWVTALPPFTWALPRGVKLHADDLKASSTPLPPVQISPHALMQAVFNLVQNAAHALAQRNAANPGHPPTGNIWIFAKLHATTPDSPPAVHLSVRDDGPGMDPRTAARCTEPFFTTKPKDRGTGLGLFLVRSAVERHGGKLLIESKLGIGSSFTLVLPIVADPSVSTAIPSHTHARQ